MLPQICTSSKGIANDFNDNLFLYLYYDSFCLLSPNDVCERISSLLLAGFGSMVFNSTCNPYGWGDMAYLASAISSVFLQSCSSFYLLCGFSFGSSRFCHLDKNEVSPKDLYYLNSLSADAAPAFSFLFHTQEKDHELFTNLADYYYTQHTWSEYRTLGIRNYNFSFAQAKKLFPRH